MDVLIALALQVVLALGVAAVTSQTPPATPAAAHMQQVEQASEVPPNPVLRTEESQAG